MIMLPVSFLGALVDYPPFEICPSTRARLIYIPLGLSVEDEEVDSSPQLTGFFFSNSVTTWAIFAISSLCSRGGPVGSPGISPSGDLPSSDILLLAYDITI